MWVLLKSVFRDYRRVWFKTFCTFIGIFISLSLFIVIELFSSLFQAPSIESKINIPYSHKLVQNNGFITDENFRDLIKHPLLKDSIPYSDVNDFFLNPEVNQHVIVRGTDRFQVFSEISANLITETDLGDIDFDPFDLSEAYLIIKGISTGTRLTLQSSLANKPIGVTCINVDIPEPVLLMDIAQFQTLYPPQQSIGALLLKLSNSQEEILKKDLKQTFPDIELLSIENEQQQQSSWVSSLTYNLAFLAFISLIVATCLMIQFFRFLGKEREIQFNQLYKLGISKTRIRQVFFIEIGIIAILTTLSALVFAKFLAQISLNTFNQLITMFYFRLNATQILYTPTIILKASLASTIAFIIAYVSFFYAKSFGKHLKTVIQISLVSLIAIAVGIITVFYTAKRVLLGLAAVAIIGGFFGICIGCVSFMGHALRRIESDRLIPFKMARDTLLKDPLSYGAIVFVISLAAGLVISMSIFIHSFSSTVKSWLNTVTFHDVYIQHQSNTIQYPISLPIGAQELMDNASDKFTISTLFRIPFIYNGLPAQVVFRKNIHDPDYSRFVFKSKLGGPYSENDVFITEPFSYKHGVKIGDTLQLNGILSMPIRVAGITYDFVSEFGQITANQDLYLQDHNQVLLHGIAIKSSQSRLLDKFIVEISNLPGVVVASQKTIMDTTIKIFNDTFSFTWFMVILTALIAVFSLVNLLTIVCMNRKHELIQLWHIGFNTNHLTRVILAQITIISIIASVISILIGFSLYVLIVYGIQLPTFNWSIFLTVPWRIIISAPIIVIILSLLIGFIFMKTIGHFLGKGRINESSRTLH
ncbi:MAG: FtsX-like permease family protein [Candidatus Margulisiibacteriota bacterium]